MSGGSFNYLCHKDVGGVLGEGREDLRGMAGALAALGHDAKDVAERTAALLTKADEMQAEIEALADVWQAVEWWQSCDYSREQVFIAIGRYRERGSDG